jgi:multidrug efflux pump subunit AcrA (membrane-fusion protein)
LQQIEFRKTALERISTPDQLDQLIQVTSLKGWIALFGLIAVVFTLVVWGIFGTIPTELNGQAILVNDAGFTNIVTNQSGVVTSLNIKSGDTVKAGQLIGTLKTADGNSLDLTSAEAGTVEEVLSQPATHLEAGASLASLVKPGAVKVEAFVSLADGKNLRPGMLAYLSPSTASSTEYGFLVGTITAVSDYPVTAQGLEALLKNDSLVKVMGSSGPVLRVDVSLNPDPTSNDGFKWSSSKGPTTPLSMGTLCSAQFILSQQAPINLVLPINNQKGAN